MKVRLKLFARARDIAGADRIEVDVPDEATIADVRTALGERFADMRALVPNLLFAIGTDYADNTSPVPADGEIACFPPVSGG